MARHLSSTLKPEIFALCCGVDASIRWADRSLPGRFVCRDACGTGPVGHPPCRMYRQEPRSSPLSDACQVT